jgi:hypothetical protein
VPAINYLRLLPLAVSFCCSESEPDLFPSIGNTMVTLVLAIKQLLLLRLLPYLPAVVTLCLL